jgi:hypothetical protein
LCYTGETIFIEGWQSAHSDTAGKFDKCLHFLSIFIAQKLTIDLIVQYVLLNIIEKLSSLLSLNPTSSPILEPRTVFGFVTLVPVISSQKQTFLFFVQFFYNA